MPYCWPQIPSEQLSEVEKAVGVGLVEGKEAVVKELEKVVVEEIIAAKVAGESGKGSSNRDTRICYCCRKSGHQAQNCPHAQEFAKMLEKRKENGTQNQKSKRPKSDVNADDDDYGEYNFMSIQISKEGNNETCHSALSAYTAALDSGCSSHTIKQSCIPKNTAIDSSSPICIQTASAGATLSAYGRASNGLVHKALVVSDSKLTKKFNFYC
jgi:hypothetical protein